MNITANMQAANLSIELNKYQKKESIGSENGETKFDVSEYKKYSYVLSYLSIDVQVKKQQNSFEQDYKEFQSFLSEIGYDGKPIAELSQDEAAALVAEDGFFGVDQTAQRIADFVIMGAGGDEQMMRDGRAGILQGFEEAEKMWGGKLPDISYETIKKAVELIDSKMAELGYNILESKA